MKKSRRIIMPDKPTVAIGLLSGCFGCLTSFLNIADGLPDLLEKIDLRRTPFNDIKGLEPVTVGILEGAVATDDNLKLAREMREKAEVLVALGTCATFGGIGGLRNLEPVTMALNNVYAGTTPDASDIPDLLPRVMPLESVVPVDVVVRGCPPDPEDILQTLLAVLSGKTLEKNIRNLCNECPRTKTSIMTPKKGFLTEGVRAVMELEEIDPDRCFLEQGVLCAGLVTVEGCGARCPRNNMPCRGCHGPASGVHGQGNKFVNAVSCLLPAGGIMFTEDIVGTGYRFGLAADIHFHEKED
jgi:F420-non-reducing hydrogenase small subunit